MEKGGPKLRRKESDEWLCSSTYRPNRSEILGQERSGERKKKKLKVVVPKRIRRVSDTPCGRPERVTTEHVDIQKTSTPSRRLSKLKIISPAIPKNVSLLRSPPVLQSRKSPEQVFASLTPRRRNSLEVVQPAPKRKKADSDEEEEEERSEDENSDCSEVSNIFDYFSPVKQPPEEKDAVNLEFSPPKTKFSLNFITGYEAQLTAFEDTQPPSEELEIKKKRDSPDLFYEDPMSIHEQESEHQMAKEFRIEVSPEKRKCVKFKETQQRNKKKATQFAEPEEPSLWKRENNIEESCGLFLQNSVFREYAIDVETQAVEEGSSCLPDDAETQKYTEAESCALQDRPLFDSPEVLQYDEMYERDELTGLSARFASLMASKSSERRLLMSDVAFGMVPKQKMQKLDLISFHRAFGMSILATRNPSSVIIVSRSSSIRRLAASCSPSAPFICDPAPSPTPAAAAPTPSLSFSQPIPVFYSVGALSAVPTTTTSSEGLRVLVNPALVSEGAL